MKSFLRIYSILSTISFICDASPFKIKSPLSVHLASTGLSTVKATIKNTGPSTLRLLNKGSILDPSPVQKFSVYRNGKPRNTDKKHN